MRGLLTAIQIITSLALIGVILLQSGKSAGLSGSIGGAAESFFGKNKARGLDALLSKVTIVSAVVFFISSVALFMTSN